MKPLFNDNFVSYVALGIGLAFGFYLLSIAWQEGYETGYGARKYTGYLRPYLKPDGNVVHFTGANWKNPEDKPLAEDAKSDEPVK